jgi:hypothetical protein
MLTLFLILLGFQQPTNLDQLRAAEIIRQQTEERASI